jgi:geranylgeranylglycerol-phosphate geranylgeranyltransferase
VKKVKAVWELMRLEHGLMIFIGILIGAIIALNAEAFPSLKNLILTFFTALFLEVSTFSLNDYYDLEIDKKNKRTDRPLVRGDISPKTALYLFYVFFPLGLICSFFVNYACFIIAVITALLAILYDVKLKEIKLLGNFYIAYVMAIPFVFGGAAVIQENTIFFEIHPAIYIIALIAFLAGSGREIMKDVQDFEGDRLKNIRSFPRFIGLRKSNVLAAFFYILAVLLSFVPFFIKFNDTNNIYYLNNFYLYIVLITDIMLLSISFQLIIKKQLKPLHFILFRKTTLIAIFIGLLAFLIGAFMK